MQLVRTIARHTERKDMNHRSNRGITGIVLSVSILTVFLLAACVSTQDDSKSLQIISHKMSSFAAGVGRQSTAVVNGRAQNTGPVSIKSATIFVEFFDDQSKLLQTGSTTRQNLAPGDIWEFAIETTGADAWKITRYTIKTTAAQ